MFWTASPVKPPLVLLKLHVQASRAASVVPMPDRAAGLEDRGVADIGPPFTYLARKFGVPGSTDRRCSRRASPAALAAPALTPSARRRRAPADRPRPGRPPSVSASDGAQRIRDAGDPDARPFDFAGALEHGAQPLRLAGAKHRGRNAVGLGGAEQQRVAALAIERDGLRLLPERRAALLVGVDRQRDGLDGAGRLAVGGAEDAADVDQARNGGG